MVTFERGKSRYQKFNHANERKHSRTSPDVQFKEFSLTKQKTRHRMVYG